jgi:hypothetical protein
MKKWKLCLMVTSAVLASAGLLYGLALSIICKGVASSEAAGWAQAIGAIAALGVAIWVSFDQHRRHEAREQRRDAEEVDGMLRSLRSEWDVILFGIQRQVGPLLEQSKPGTAFMITYPVAEQPFKVYYGLIPKLGMIKNTRLRQQIILAYGRGQGVVLTFRHNNALIESHQEAQRRAATGVAYDIRAAENAWEILCTYGDALRTNYAETKIEVTNLLAMLPTA